MDIISALKLRQSQLAASALTKPEKLPFDHGYQVGVYAGMQQAIDIILEMQDQPKKAATLQKESVYS